MVGLVCPVARHTSAATNHGSPSLRTQRRVMPGNSLEFCALKSGSTLLWPMLPVCITA